MSAEATGDAWRRSPYRDGAQHAKFLVHLAIADVVNDVHEMRFWMNRDELARKATVSVRTVETALAELVSLRWLEVLVLGKRDQPTEYRYYLSGSCPATVATQSATEYTAMNGGRTSSIPREHEAHLFDAAALADEFEQWWAQYPRKTDKQKARRCYNARRSEGTPAAALLRARDAYAATVIDTDVKYIKHGATFLAKGPDAPWTEYVDGDPAVALDDPGSITQQLGRQQWGRT